MSEHYQSCHLCDNPSEFQCMSCGHATCGNDVRIRAVCTKCQTSRHHKYTIHQAFGENVDAIAEMVLRFWGDPIQQMFNQSYRVTEHPAFVAKSENKIIGFISYTNFREDAVLIVALGILPQYQGCGIGSKLIAQVTEYVKAHGKHQLYVVTSNDNLPALAFYQQLGFQLYEVIPDVIARKLGGIQLGIANIPIRDELRLRKTIS